MPGTVERLAGNVLDSPAHLSVRHAGYHDVLQGIDAEWHGGEMVGLIGPNGAGKSTLMRLLAGIWQATEGSVSLNGKPLQEFSARQRAREIAYLPQEISGQIPYTVAEFVEMGRYAYRNAWGGLDRASRRAVADAMARANLAAFADASMAELSGGERQRAAIARCLAQGSPVILLDEPIASLDLYYQLDILEQLRGLARDGYLIVLVLHNLELAAQYCSRLLLLREGAIYRQGQADEVLDEPALRDVFRVKMRIFADPFGGHLRLSPASEREWEAPEPSGSSGSGRRELSEADRGSVPEPTDKTARALVNEPAKEWNQA